MNVSTKVVMASSEHRTNMILSVAASHEIGDLVRDGYEAMPAFSKRAPDVPYFNILLKHSYTGHEKVVIAIANGKVDLYETGAEPIIDRVFGNGEDEKIRFQLRDSDTEKVISLFPNPPKPDIRWSTIQERDERKKPLTVNACVKKCLSEDWTHIDFYSTPCLRTYFSKRHVRAAAINEVLKKNHMSFADWCKQEGLSYNHAYNTLRRGDAHAKIREKISRLAQRKIEWMFPTLEWDIESYIERYRS